MQNLVRYLLIMSVAVAVCVDVNAAGFSSSSSQSGEEAHFKPEQIIAFAKKVERTLAAKGARVAVLARMGRPLSELPEGMRFTHVGFAVYSEITTSDGRKVPGYSIYNLYQENDRPDVSSLVQDFPVDFFAGVAQLEAGIIIPSAELQRRLLDVIASPTYKTLHDPHYSVIANPYTVGRQNCTEFVLDVVNAAIYQTSDIKVIKANEKAYFVAQPVNVSPFKLMLGAMFSAEVSTSDQDGPPVTATFEKLGEYLQKYDAGSEVITVLPDSTSAMGDTSISNQFSGIQRVLAPDGSVLGTSRVFVDGTRLRLEISQRGPTGAAFQGVLIRRDTGEMHLVSNERKDATLLDPARPIQYLSSDFLMIVPLVEDKFEGQRIVRRKIRQEQISNQVCDVLQATLTPEFDFVVFVNQTTRLPVRVEFGPRPRGPLAEWSNVVAGPQSPKLFVIPADYKILALPDAGAESNCAIIIKAQQLMLDVPGTREYSARPDPSGEMKSEKLHSVLTADALYYMTNAGWKKLGRKEWAAKGAAMIKERRYRGCKAVGAETVNGTPTTRYELRYEMSEGDRRALVSQGLTIKDPVGHIWIGADGLMYKMLMPPFAMARYEFGTFEAPK